LIDDDDDDDEGLWRMRRHGPVIAQCTEAEEYSLVPFRSYRSVLFK